MSVEDFNNCGFHGFRVRRCIAGVKYQRYFSIFLPQKNKFMSDRQVKATYLHACVYDSQLKRMQEEKTIKIDRDFIPTYKGTKGGVKGITRLWRYYHDQKGNKKAYKHDVYDVFIKSTLTHKLAHHSFRVDKLGDEGAWTKAVEFFAKHKKVKNYKYLLKRGPYKKLTDVK